MYKNNTIKRFWNKVRKQDNESCWEWIGAKNSDGYGHIGIPSTEGQKFVKAHRMAWELQYGSIPSTKCVCHTCDNPSCVNPNHLFIATHAENMTDMKNKGRAIGHTGDENCKAKLSDDDVREIRKLYEKGSYGLVKMLSKKYHVHKSTIHRAVNGDAWSHVQ